MKRTIDIPVDWFVRTYGAADWRPLYTEMAKHVKMRTRGAELSSQLYILLERLRQLVAAKEASYGTGDIVPLPAAMGLYDLANRTFGDPVNSLTRKLHSLYSIPLHMMTILNQEIDLLKLQQVLALNDAQPNIGSSQTLQVAKIFASLFRNFTGFDDLQSPDLIDYDAIMVPYIVRFGRFHAML